jgi:hypothetical protein
MESSYRTKTVRRRLFMEELSSPLSSRPKRSAVERSLCGYSFLVKYLFANV